MTPKQKMFTEEYLVDLNSTRAAKRAGYSPQSAYSQGQRLLKNVEIQKAIKERQFEKLQQLSITQDDVLAGLLSEAKYRGPGASHTARVNAWEKLGRHLGMFNIADTLDSSANTRIEAARKRFEAAKIEFQSGPSLDPRRSNLLEAVARCREE